jgi:hypothetical protein
MVPAGARNEAQPTSQQPPRSYSSCVHVPPMQTRGTTTALELWRRGAQAHETMGLPATATPTSAVAVATAAAAKLMKRTETVGGAESRPQAAWAAAGGAGGKPQDKRHQRWSLICC